MIHRSVRTAQLQRDMATGLAWPCNNARSDGHSWLSRDRYIAKFLVFPGSVRTLCLPMQARAGNALAEVAPVRRLKRTGTRMRAGRNHMTASLDQLPARGENPLPTGWRSRFDNHKRVRGQLPESLQDRTPSIRCKLVQDISHDDQIARFAVDCINGDVRNAPRNLRQFSLGR